MDPRRIASICFFLTVGPSGGCERRADVTPPPASEPDPATGSAPLLEPPVGQPSSGDPLVGLVQEIDRHDRLRAVFDEGPTAQAADGFEGTVVCRVRTVHGNARPRVIVVLGQDDTERTIRRATGRPSDAAERDPLYFGTPGFRAPSSGRVRVDVHDDFRSGDSIHLEYVASLDLPARGSFPWTASARGLELSCLGVDPGRFAGPTNDALAAAERAVTALEQAGPPSPAQHAQEVRYAAMYGPRDEAHGQLVMLQQYLAYDDPRIVTLRGRREEALARIEQRIAASVDEGFAAAPPMGASLPVGATGLTLAFEGTLCPEGDRRTRWRFGGCFVLARVENAGGSTRRLDAVIARVMSGGDLSDLDLRRVPEDATAESLRRIPPTDGVDVPPGVVHLAVGPTPVPARLSVRAGESTRWAVVE